MFQKIVSDIYLLKTALGSIWGGVILICGKRNILIDCGTAQAPARDILPALAQTGLPPESIELLLVTHTHGDHIGGLAAMQRAAGAPVAASAPAAEKLLDPSRFGRAIRSRYPEDSPREPVCLEPVTVERVMQDGELAAGRLQMLTTPGHDSDAVVWLDQDTGTLITGDSVQLGGTATQGAAFYCDLAAYRRSMQRLLALDAENLIAGHDFFPMGFLARGRSAVRACLERSLEMTERYDQLVRRMEAQGQNDLRAIAAELCRVSGQRPPEKLFMAMITASEHIITSKCEVSQ